jgi:hypothetical protein
MTTSLPRDPADGIVPDTKDWTWTLGRPCPECGFEAAAVRAHDVAEAVRAATAPWSVVLARPDVAERPDPATWSPLEYGCHVRDVCRVFDVRLRSMLAVDDPLFDNWDQDATAAQDRYGEQDPGQVARELDEAASRLAGTFGQVPSDRWSRTVTRSNGSRFTVLTLGQYALHDLVHHLHDVDAPIR